MGFPFDFPSLSAGERFMFPGIAGVPPLNLPGFSGNSANPDLRQC